MTGSDQAQEDLASPLATPSNPKEDPALEDDAVPAGTIWELYAWLARLPIGSPS